jgi:tetratricopeptide (TPR) repeat protein
MDEVDMADRMMREAVALDRQDRVAEAIAAYQAVLRRWPGIPDVWYSLAVLQRRAGLFSAALASYQQALDFGIKRPEEVHLNRGVIFADHLLRAEEAQLELEAALAINPAYVPGLMNLANLHEDRGRREDAKAIYERILAIDARRFEALARYANLHPSPAMDDSLIGRLRVALADPAANSADRASLGFALGRALDACGSYDAAFAAYSQANRDSRESAGPGAARYDRDVERSLVDRLRAAFPAAEGGARRSERPRPIFICGMFRSGSTLVEQLLAGHARITPAGELDLLPQLAQGPLAPFPESLATMPLSLLEATAGRYESALRTLFPEAEFVTDKRPDNFIYIGLIKKVFPDAKIVHTTRDPLDTCLSTFFLHLDHRMSYALDLMDTGHHFKMYRELMTYWKKAYSADIFDVSYERLVREPKPVIEGLLSFLGLEWDERCLTVPPGGRAIRTASVWQVREPLHRRSSGRASHYANQLDELRRYLAEPDPNG